MDVLCVEYEQTSTLLPQSVPLRSSKPGGNLLNTKQNQRSVPWPTMKLLVLLLLQCSMHQPPRRQSSNWSPRSSLLRFGLPAVHYPRIFYEPLGIVIRQMKSPLCADRWAHGLEGGYSHLSREMFLVHLGRFVGISVRECVCVWVQLSSSCSRRRRRRHINNNLLFSYFNSTTSLTKAQSVSLALTVIGSGPGTGARNCFKVSRQKGYILRTTVLVIISYCFAPSSDQDPQVKSSQTSQFKTVLVTRITFSWRIKIS